MGVSSQPASWGDLLKSYRASWGCASFASAAGTPSAVRFTRSVPGVCPLAETGHPLYAVDAQDGSLQRSRWHGWGDVSLLKQACTPGEREPHHKPARVSCEGKRQLPAPCAAGRRSLFGLLQGTEAGQPDAWLGHPSIDPAKGRRALSAPTDEKRSVSFAVLLSHTAPGDPGADAWVGNSAIDPAKGKAHAPDPSSLRGRPDLFVVLQQQPVGAGSDAVRADAWIGNRLLQPSKGRRAGVAAAGCRDHLMAATFRDGPPIDGCWSDLPPVGKRPLRPPSDVANFVTAAQTLRMEEPLPQGTLLGAARPQGKATVPAPFAPGSASTAAAKGSAHTDAYACMTFQPLSQAESTRYTRAWDDASVQPRRRAAPGLGAAAARRGPGSGPANMLSWQPARVARYVPFGGLAQEQGMTLDAIVANRAHLGGTSRAPGRGSGAGSGSGSGAKSGGGGDSKGGGGGSSSSSGGKGGARARP